MEVLSAAMQDNGQVKLSVSLAVPLIVPLAILVSCRGMLATTEATTSEMKRERGVSKFVRTCLHQSYRELDGYNTTRRPCGNRMQVYVRKLAVLYVMHTQADNHASTVTDCL